jgi:RHS Repeat
MRKLLVALCALSAVLVSCQKEIGFNNGNPAGSGSGSGSGSGGGTSGGSSNGNLLVKVAYTDAAGSATLDYTYDAANRLILQSLVGKVGGLDATQSFRLIRDASGVVTQVITKGAQMALYGVDSTVAIAYYDASKKRYSALSTPVNVAGMGALGTDSSVFIYDAAGKIVEQDDYTDMFGVVTPTSKNMFTYTGGNLTREQLYAASGLASTVDYTYDTKVNPLPIGTEAFLIGSHAYVSANNQIDEKVTSALLPSASYELTTTYTYNSSNKPATAVGKGGPGNLNQNATFYYK